MGSPRGFLVPADAARPSRVSLRHRRLKATGADTDGAFMVVEFVLTHDIPPHIHLRQHESFYVLDGSLAIEVGDDEFSAGLGDFVFLPANVPHAIRPTGDSRPALLVVATPNAQSGGVWPLMPGAPDVRRRNWAEMFGPRRGLGLSN